MFLRVDVDGKQWTVESKARTSEAAIAAVQRRLRRDYPNAREFSVTLPSQHYYGATGLHWAVADTREEVLAKLARNAGAVLIRKQQAQGGLYAWTVRVDLPIDARYHIKYYMPKDVPMDDMREFDILDAKGTARERPARSKA